METPKATTYQLAVERGMFTVATNDHSCGSRSHAHHQFHSLLQLLAAATVSAKGFAFKYGMASFLRFVLSGLIVSCRWWFDYTTMHSTWKGSLFAPLPGPPLFPLLLRERALGLLNVKQFPEPRHHRFVHELLVQRRGDGRGRLNSGHLRRGQE